MTRCRGQRCRAAFECRDLGLEDSLGWVHDPRVDVPEGSQRKEIGRMLHIVEYIGRGLINWRGPRPGRWVRLGTGMDSQGVESRNLFVAHGTSLV